MPIDEDLRIQLPDSRSRSAPGKAQRTYRKNWNASSINIQTARGEKMHVSAPGKSVLQVLTMITYFSCNGVLPLIFKA